MYVSEIQTCAVRVLESVYTGFCCCKLVYHLKVSAQSTQSVHRYGLWREHLLWCVFTGQTIWQQDDYSETETLTGKHMKAAPVSMNTLICNPRGHYCCWGQHQHLTLTVSSSLSVVDLLCCFFLLRSVFWLFPLSLSQNVFEEGFQWLRASIFYIILTNLADMFV